MNVIQKNTAYIKDEAKKLGFYEIGISKAERLTEEDDRFSKWLDNGFHGSMSYMENNFDKRLDPTQLVKGAKSVISFMFNYYTETNQSEKSRFKVSKYAYGRDYHKVIKNKLNKLMNNINDNLHSTSGRAFVDSAPILERSWAKKSGLGWIGKNSMLINQIKGSYFFLAELIIDLELEYDKPISNHCGNCTRCIDACPTNAISSEGYIVDARKCISFLTIENKNDIPEEFKDKMEDFIFGCDICQQVCPWNKFSEEHNEPDFIPKEKFLNLTENDWKNLSENEYEDLFFGTPIVRTKYSGIKRNISFIK